ncbi:ankyrin repeat-containing domain protein [Baffinella frigidus]|nr:ankyrin repeat-containing domain protein [Cryptophyta sp. CCMP2293]
MCAGCAAKALAVSNSCPSCRAPLSGAQANISMRGLIESVCAAEPGRMRAVVDTMELDVAELALAGHLERIAQERTGPTIHVPLAAPAGEAAAVLDAAGRLEAICRREAAQEQQAAEEEAAMEHVNALFEASREGSVDIVREMLVGNADVHDNGGYSPLRFAAQQGHSEVVSELLGAGADVDSSGFFLLYVPAWKGHIEVFELLLGANADVDQERKGPLHWTCQFGNSARKSCGFCFRRARSSAHRAPRNLCILLRGSGLGRDSKASAWGGPEQED